MILDPLELCWTEVSNFQEGAVQTFCGLYGGIRGHLGPKMGPQIGPRGPPRGLKIQLIFQENLEPSRGDFFGVGFDPKNPP